MGVREYRGRIVVDKHWPDGSRTIRAVPNRTQGKQLLAQMEGSIANGKWVDFKIGLRLRRREVLTLKDFSKSYLEDYAKPRNKLKSWKRKVTSLKPLKAFMGDVALSAITPGLLHKYVQKRKAEGLSNASINRDLTTIKHMLSHALERGLIDTNPVEKFKKLVEDQNERPRFSEAQVQAVLDALSPIHRPLFTFIRETGCRREEALSLTHSQIHQQMVVFDKDTKSRKYRYVPLTQVAMNAISAQPRLEGCRYVFHNPETGQRWSDCRKPWIRARETAGVPELQVKDLRRLYAITLAEAGANMHDIQQVLGHASVSTTEKHYAQFSPSHSAWKILAVLDGGRSEMETNRKHESEVLGRVG